MGVLEFQIGIIAIIFASSFFGRKLRNYIVVFCIIFTVFAVFTDWLLFLQFVTIFISYQVSNFILNKIEIGKRINNERKSNSFYIVFLLVLAIGYAIYVNYEKSNTPRDKKINYKIADTIMNKSSHRKIFYDSISYIQIKDYSNDSISESNVLEDSIDYSVSTSEEIEYIYSNIDSGEFTFYKSRTSLATTGKLIIDKISNKKFHFKFFVENNTNTGEVSGVAKITSLNHAVFYNEDCKSLTFDFFDNGSINILESQCQLYHGDNINFNGYYR